MKSKIFEAETIQMAIAHVKDEMGPDAMILSTHRLPSNPRDPYSKKKFAVEAAPKGSLPEQIRKKISTMELMRLLILLKMNSQG